jgi:hypothetical protein
MEDNNNERLKITISELQEYKKRYKHFYFFYIYINEIIVIKSPEFDNINLSLKYKEAFNIRIVEDYELIEKILNSRYGLDEFTTYISNVLSEDYLKYIYKQYSFNNTDKILSEEVIDYLSKQKGVDNSNSKGESIFFDVNEKDSELFDNRPLQHQMLECFFKLVEEQELSETFNNIYNELNNIKNNELDEIISNIKKEAYKKSFDIYSDICNKKERELKKEISIITNEVVLSEQNINKLSEKNKKLKAKNKKLTKQLRKLTATINTGE